MSANNYILIQETKNGFTITHRDADTRAQYGKIARAKTLRKAVEIANEIILTEEVVEYGIQIKLLKKGKAYG